MSGWKKLASAAAASGEALNVEDVFSTYLYEGENYVTQTIDNGIDLSTEGGMVWTKNRTSSSGGHNITYTDDSSDRLVTNSTAAADTAGTNFSYTTTGYTVGGANAYYNETGYDFVSWTFRKAPKFFDVVTYTGNSGTNVISHNLGSTPGCMIIKCTSSSAPSGTTSQWMVYHRGLSSPTTSALYLNGTSGAQIYGTGLFAVSDTTFTLNNTNETNDTGNTYVAYLFAHNDGDGEFGPTGDQDIIKCGSYTGNGSTTGPEIDLGFEPQWVMIRRTDSSADWNIIDVMRGWPMYGTAPKELMPNTSAAEANGANGIDVLPNGFQIKTSNTYYNASSGNYIYIAIRRGPMAVPESVDDVFAQDTWGGTVTAPPAFYSGWPVDATLTRSWATAANNSITTRKTDNRAMFTNTASNGTFGSAGALYDLQDGFFDTTGTISTYIAHMWRRSPTFFDDANYYGNNGTAKTYTHNLGATPEMIWTKRSDGGSADWYIYHKDLGSGKYVKTDQYNPVTSSTIWDNTAPTDTTFRVGSQYLNNASAPYTALLFASVDGISKVGSFSHTSGSTTNVDCGFSNGAQFVLIKKTTDNEHWLWWNTTWGINAGNENHLRLGTTNYLSQLEEDWIDPLSSGFQMSTGLDTGTYLFYAVAAS